MKQNMRGEKLIGIELDGDVGYYTRRLEPNVSVYIHHKRPFAIVGLTVLPLPSQENQAASIAIQQGKHPAFQVSIFQLQRRRVWPTLLFYLGAADVEISTLNLVGPVELRLQWEAIEP